MMPARTVGWQRGDFSVVLSEEILTEVNRALHQSYFLSRFGEERIRAYLSLLRSTARVVPITVEVHGVATHPEDDLILATALSAQADYLVTGDRQLQNLESSQGVTILSPRAFLELLESESASGGEQP